MEGVQFLGTSGEDLHQPLRVAEKGTSDRDEVELLALHAVEQLHDVGDACLLPLEHLEELIAQTHRAHADGGLPRHLLRPAREVEVGALELGEVEAPRGAVEDVGASLGQQAEDGLQFLRRLGDPGRVVVHLPLGEPERDRELRRHGRAAGGHDLGREPGAAGGITAVAVGAPVGVGPQELVDQITVAAVDLHTVEAECLGRSRGRRIGGDHVVDVGLGHRVARARAVQGDTGGTDRRGPRHGRIAGGAVHADMPQLRHDPTALPVDRLGHRGPAGQRLVAVEVRYPGAGARRVMTDVGALGEDQADAAGGPPGVVPRHVLARHPAGGELARHRSHHDTVGQGETTQGEGTDQDVPGTLDRIRGHQSSPSIGSRPHGDGG
nr:oxidoreductase [Streptomyces sp.]